MIPDNNVSPALRLEIFKRDRFTCRRCGAQVPKAVLYVDKIDAPVPNDTYPEDNLVTICTSCYNQLHRLRQPSSLEMLPQRKEQLKMLVDWRKDWQDFGQFAVQLAADYICSRLEVTELDRNTINEIARALQSTHILTFIDIVDQAFVASIHYTENGKVAKKTEKTFIDNIFRFLYHQQKNPLEQKIGYVRGACRNKYGIDYSESSMALLKSYAAALQRKGWSNDQIIKDLNDSVLPVVNHFDNYSAFENQINSWISDINSW